MNATQFFIFVVFSNPLLLLELTKTNFTRLLAVAWAEIPARRRFCRELLRTYHIQPCCISDPELALEELVLRLVFEFFIKRVRMHHFQASNWRLGPGRDAGHQARLERLISCIAISPVMLSRAQQCQWLRLQP